MQSMNSNTTSILLLSIGAVILFLIDPFNLEGVHPALRALNALPFFAYWYLYVYHDNVYNAKGLTDVDKEYINKESWKSFLRSVIQVVGSITAFSAAVGVDIPYIGIVSDLATYIESQLDVAVEAIITLIGIGLYLYGYFKNPDRFKQRVLLEPRKIE
jgi:succinate dehydrogenase hydrophobic anchor subunit